MAFEEDVKAGRSTGNWGILDIQSALRWVQREVSVFGGDPKKVAIHGQSSGGGLVELQYVAPGSKGLFRGAISESGSLGAMDLPTALQSSASVAKAVGCQTHSGEANKSCLIQAPGLNITSETYSGSWGPLTDGVTFPLAPETLLERGLVNDATIVLGAQTNDSNLFLFRSYTKGGLPQPNSQPDGALTPLRPLVYSGIVLSMVGAHLAAEALKLYPPSRVDHVMNVHQLGNIQSDRMHCDARRRAALINRVHPNRAFQYRFDYWYTSNPACTAIPNYHLPYLGAAHQDEVTFVLGQPNFMEAGSCCGAWGLTTSDCPHLPDCEACYAPKRFGHDGYRGYFDDTEWAFARTVGRFWTNIAASGDPNIRGEDAEEKGVRAWPPVNESASRNIVLNASLPGGFAVELTPHGRPELCTFWDKVVGERVGHPEEPLVV